MSTEVESSPEAEGQSQDQDEQSKVGGEQPQEGGKSPMEFDTQMEASNENETENPIDGASNSNGEMDIGAADDGENEDADADDFKEEAADAEDETSDKGDGSKENPSDASKAQKDETKDDEDGDSAKPDQVKSSEKGGQDEGLSLGGATKKKAFALLTGKFKDIKDSNKETIISVPITTLPAILGRHSTNEHIFELGGKCKQLSRKHAIIFYSDVYGGKIGKFKNDPSGDYDGDDVKIDGIWSYRPPENPSEDNLIRKKDASSEQGFFAITCMSKNKIIVDGKRVEQGETAALKHGSTIKMLTFTLYFLLPKPDSIKSRVISVPHPIHAEEDDDEEIVTPAQKKQKIEKDPPSSSRGGAPEEQKPLPELVKEFVQAVETDTFERKHSMISTSILQHAVTDAANDAALREQSDKEGGVSRTLLMEWIAANESYTNYVSALLTKLEVKSYQQNLSRALIKGGFVRLGTTGRHIKWLLPELKKMKASGSKKQGKNNDRAEKDTSSKKSSVTSPSLVPSKISSGDTMEESEDSPKKEEEASDNLKEPETPMALPGTPADDDKEGRPPSDIPDSKSPGNDEASGDENDSPDVASEKLNLEDSEEDQNPENMTEERDDAKNTAEGSEDVVNSDTDRIAGDTEANVEDSIMSESTKNDNISKERDVEKQEPSNDAGEDDEIQNEE